MDLLCCHYKSVPIERLSRALSCHNETRAEISNKYIHYLYTAIVARHLYGHGGLKVAPSVARNHFLLSGHLYRSSAPDLLTTIYIQCTLYNIERHNKSSE